MSNSSNNINNFEEMMTRLRTIADTMENEEVTLAESLKLFEEGMTLGKECRGILGSVEVRVNEIKEQAKRVGITPPTAPSDAQTQPNSSINPSTSNANTRSNTGSGGIGGHPSLGDTPLPF